MGAGQLITLRTFFPDMVGTSLKNEVVIAISSSKNEKRETLSSSQSEIRGVNILTIRHHHDMLVCILKAQQHLSQGLHTSQQVVPLSRPHLRQGLPLLPRRWFHREAVAQEKRTQNRRNTYSRNGSLQQKVARHVLNCPGWRQIKRQ